MVGRRVAASVAVERVAEASGGFRRCREGLRAG